MSHTSGLAAAIRGSTESDTFDLAGQNVSTISTNITNAFQEPFALEDMIRITLVTGAGKLARQKYDENAAKAVTAALRELGFEEDRGASCVKECAGTFKLQHDTGKNLKTVVVFPKICDVKNNYENTEGDGPSSSSTDQDSFFPKSSPKEMIAKSSKQVFETMVKNKCPSWSQKKGCGAAIVEIKTVLEELEQKLLKGTPLSDTEQSFYDQVSSTALEEKLNYIKDQMHQQVEEERVTTREKTQLLSQVEDRIDALNKEIAEAEKNKQPKKVEKLKTMKEKAQARKEKLSKLTPKQPFRLKHEAEIFKLKTELQPLFELEEGAKGRLLSIKEAQSLARKEEILNEIVELENNSRGWFEDDEAFAQRVEACNSAWAAQNKTKRKSSTATTSKKVSTGPSTNAWFTAAPTKQKVAGKPKPTSNKPKTGGKGGGVFAAMMMDSDSE